MVVMRVHLSSLFTTMLLGIGIWSASANAATVDDRSMALAYIANDLFGVFLAYPDVADEYENGEPGTISDMLLERSGAASVGLERDGTEADRVAVAALLGRAFLYRGDRAEALRRLEAALDAAGGLGWDDRRANGILRDLAWLAEAAGDPVAADYARRADLCPLPCTDDASVMLHADAELAEEAIYSAFGRDLGYARITATLGDDMLAFAEANFAPASPEVLGVWRSRASSARQDRPWQALEYYQRLLELMQAAGTAAPEVLDVRRSIATVLLETGEYVRLAAFAEGLLPDAMVAVTAHPDVLYIPAIAMTAARLRARALWHMRAPEARDAYVIAVDTMFEFGDSDMAELLLQDLVDAGYDGETVRVADALVNAFPGDAGALFAKARVAARSGDFAEAAALVAGISDSPPIARLQQAAYLDLAGREDEARQVRSDIVVFDPDNPTGWSPWSMLSELIDARDAGAHEGAAEAALSYLDYAERLIANGEYLDAQRLWQIAYTLAMGGETKESFRLMNEAASIAARLSFAAANDTDGGSLQLLRRDKFRYLLFVDIAWAAATGGSPDAMTVSSRY